MGLATLTAYKTIVMALLALVGVFCYKRNIVNEEMNKTLSDLVLTLFTPILLFTSFQKEYSKDIQTGLLLSVLLSAVSFVVIWIICKIVVRKQPDDYARLELVAIMYSNCGFIGIPMAQGIFGNEGVMYMTAYVAMANFLLWSHGVIAMSGKSDFNSVKKVFRSPTIIAIILGVLCFVFQIRMPQIIEEPMEMIAAMNTPMAMLVAGVNIAQASLRDVFKRKRSYWLCFVRLIIMPTVMIGIFYFMPVSDMLKTVMILASSCPVGVTGSLFALRYNKDAIYASELFAMSTILAVITIPFMMLICG